MRVCVQVDRYKQLLLKQRDIMIALTARLNERDEQIMALQVRQREVQHRRMYTEDCCAKALGESLKQC